MTELQSIKLNDETRPLVTYALFTFNQEKYVLDAVKSALNQTYSPLEIIISDDCSTDSTYNIAQKIIQYYKGPHKIILNRNEKNIGVTNQFNKIFHIAAGNLIIAAAGDDYSTPTRAERVAQEWIKNKLCSGAICSSWIPIDGEGKKSGPPCSNKKNIEDFYIQDRKKHKYHGLIQGACAAWTKDLITRYGNISPDGLCEDLELSYRAAFLGKILLINEPLVYYRIIDDSVSNFNKKNNLSKTIQWHKTRISALNGLEIFLSKNVEKKHFIKINKNIKNLKIKYYVRIKINQIKIIIRSFFGIK